MIARGNSSTFLLPAGRDVLDNTPRDRDVRAGAALAPTDISRTGSSTMVGVVAAAPPEHRDSAQVEAPVESAKKVCDAIVQLHVATAQGRARGGTVSSSKILDGHAVGSRVEVVGDGVHRSTKVIDLHTAGTSSSSRCQVWERSDDRLIVPAKDLGPSRRRQQTQHPMRCKGGGAAAVEREPAPSWS